MLASLFTCIFIFPNKLTLLIVTMDLQFSCQYTYNGPNKHCEELVEVSVYLYYSNIIEMMMKHPARLNTWIVGKAKVTRSEKAICDDHNNKLRRNSHRFKSTGDFLT